MLALWFKRFKSEGPANVSDLNKKILEAFTSIIDKGSKISASQKEHIIEPIPRYNVDSKISVSRIQDYKHTLSSHSSTEPLLLRNPPDIFRRNKMSPQFLHKNVFLMSKMLSPSGSMIAKSLTKLSSKTHRHMSKAIRRARQMGIIPYMYRPKVNVTKQINIQDN